MISYNEKLGIVIQLMCISKSQHGKSLAYLRNIVEPAIRLELIKLYFNEDGAPVGYIIWAMLDAKGSMLAETQGIHSVEPGLWRLGEMLWVIDFLAPLGNAKYIFRNVRDELFRESPSWQYSRETKNGRKVNRRISRRSGLPLRLEII